MNRSLIALGAVALMSFGAAGTAAAADVYWSVGVQGPGVVTHVGNRPPPPHVVVVQPGTVYVPAPSYYRPPVQVYQGAPQVIVYPAPYPGHRWHHRHDRHDRQERWERHGHGRFDAHGGRWGDRDRRDEYGDRWER